MKILKNEPLAKHTTFRLGGPADYFVRVKGEEEFGEAVRAAKKLAVPYFILGAGSNILVADKGYRGMVIKNEMAKMRIVGYKGKVKAQSAKRKAIYIEAQTGVLVNRLVRFTLEQGFSGLENFLGQPGSVGGAIYMNAHNIRKNDFFGEHLLEAKVMDKEENLRIVPWEYFQFAYDKSKIQRTGEIVLSCILELRQEESKEKLWQKAEKVLAYRRKTQPFGLSSSGCVFRNIKKAEAMRLGTPNYTCSAGFLIETAGLKGKQIGQAKISEKHANFIVNLGGAKAAEVLKLIELAKIKVREKFGVELVEEIVLVGEF